MTDSAMTGFTLPGMIEDPGCTVGSWSSPRPARGPDPIQRMSFAIFISPVAYVRRVLDVNTSASSAACAWKWLFVSRISRPTSWDKRAQPPRANSGDRKSTRLNSSHQIISYAVFCLKKKKNMKYTTTIATESTCNTTQLQSQNAQQRALVNQRT